MAEAYPLYWPAGMPRTKGRAVSRFKTSLPRSVSNVQDELRRFGNDTGKRVTDTVISSNVTLMEQRPADPGVACFFKWDGLDVCLAVDRYRTPMENLQAIAKVIEAERAKMRHGGLNIVRASFRGWAGLPPPNPSAGELAAPWRQVLGLVSDCANLENAERKYRALVKENHPDRGGDAVKFNAIVDAMRSAREELGAQ